MKLNKIPGLICCILMMCATALCVNKTLFGHSFDESESESAAGDTLTVVANGSVIIHTGLLTDVPGYAGPVPLEITISEGVIKDITPAANAESPGFFRRAAVLLDQWKGRTAAEAAEMQIDAVTGATYTSNAIIANVYAGLEYYLDSPHSDRHTPMPWKMWVALAVTSAACVVPLFVRNKYYRRAQMLANILVLGFWCGRFLDYALMLRYLSEGFVMPGGLVAIVMLVAAFVYPIFGHPQHYCNHICPLGSAQILVAELCHYKIRLSRAALRAMDWFRKVLWAVLMLCLLADVFTGWMDMELFQAFMVQSAPVGVIIAAIVFVALSAVVSRPYCRFVCPTGSLFKFSEK